MWKAVVDYGLGMIDDLYEDDNLWMLLDKIKMMPIDVEAKIRESHEGQAHIKVFYVEKAQYVKEFDLYPGDRVRVAMPAVYPFPAGWAEGTVIDAHFYPDNGWYVELNKDQVSSGWQTGYGYWKQDQEGGTIEKIL